MAAEHGRNMGTGRVPGLNTERIYSTTIPADELAQALADHFRAQGRGSRSRSSAPAGTAPRCRRARRACGATCWGSPTR